MEYEKLIKSSTLDKLYENENEEFEEYIINKNPKNYEIAKDGRILEEIKELVRQFVNNEEKYQKFEDKIKELEIAHLEELEFWCRNNFKRGFVNHDRLKIDIERNKKEEINFWDLKEFSFEDYLEKKINKKLLLNKEYKELYIRISGLKKKHPKVRGFLEEGTTSEFNIEEQNAIIDILDLENSMNVISEKEIFKLGMKEGIKLLNQ